MARVVKREGRIVPMASAMRRYGGVSADERRARRRAAFIDAALDLFAEAGAAGVTKRAVCARAGLNDRYFYEDFADTDALLEAVAQEFAGQGLERVVGAAASAGPDIRARVHAAATALIDFITSDRRWPCLLLASHTSDVLQRTRQASTHRVTQVMSTMSRESLGDVKASSADTDLAAFILVSGTLELVSAWLRSEFPSSREHLIDVITAVLLAATDLSAHLPSAPPPKSREPDVPQSPAR